MSKTGTVVCTECKQPGHNKARHRSKGGVVKAEIVVPSIPQNERRIFTSATKMPSTRGKTSLNVTNAFDKTQKKSSISCEPIQVEKREKSILEKLKTRGREKFLASNPFESEKVNPTRKQPQALMRNKNGSPEWGVGTETLLEGSCYMCGDYFYECESDGCETPSVHIVHAGDGKCRKVMENISSKPCDIPKNWEEYSEDGDED